MQQNYLTFVSPNEVLSVKSFGLSLFNIVLHFYPAPHPGARDVSEV